LSNKIKTSYNTQVVRKKLKKYKKSSHQLGFISIFVILFAVLGLFVFYQSRRIPELGEESQITMLPQEMLSVLGTKTGPQLFEKQERVPVFLYHYIEYVKDDPGRQKLTVPPNIFISQIETLKNAGYTFITPNDLMDDLLGKTKLPEKLVILTFDDGYMDFYTDVFPILKKENVKGVAYIVPNFLNRPNYMFTFQLKEVAKSPLVEIGAHTMNHVWLKGISKATAKYEISQSKKSLADMLHLSINSFAYPYGALDQQAVDLVKNAGYTNAVSTIPGIVQTEQNKFFLYRLRPGYRRGEELIKFLSQKDFQPW